MSSLLYLCLCWFVMSCMLWLGLPAEDRSLFRIASIELVAVVIWFGAVCFLA